MRLGWWLALLLLVAGVALVLYSLASRS